MDAAELAARIQGNVEKLLVRKAAAIALAVAAPEREAEIAALTRAYEPARYSPQPVRSEQVALARRTRALIARALTRRQGRRPPTGGWRRPGTPSPRRRWHVRPRHSSACRRRGSPRALQGAGLRAPKCDYGRDGRWAAMRRWLVLLLCLAVLGAGGCRSQSAAAPPLPPVPPLTPPQQLGQGSSREYTIQGVTFKAQMDLGCTTPVLTEATPQEIAASPLRFMTSYLPGGFALLREQWSACDGRVAAGTRIYQDSNGLQYVVSRYTARSYPQPVEVARALKEPVAGKAAIALGNHTLIVVESFGITVLQGPDFGELSRIAEGMR